MKSNILIEEVTQYLQRSMEEEQSDDREKVNAILASSKEHEKEVQAIKEFMSVSGINEQKVLSFAIDFVDPTQTSLKPQTPTVKMKNGEEVVLNRYLHTSELMELNRFVENHKNDRSFGEEVYKIMDKHGMTAPQVYNGVLMRRQDFSRVTDSRCKSVTRRMAWQIIIGLHCTLEEADALLFSAGYIRRRNKLDLTIQYFIEHKNYDIEAIDSVLEELKEKTFTC